jgi:methylphosphotriester-DNA--protein-cysteine methyltransferase
VWLAGFHHPGDTVSSQCLKELVEAAEAQAHVRPRRRTEMIQQRLAAQEESIARLRRLLDQQQAKAGRLRQTRQELMGKIYHTEQLQKGPISRKKSSFLKKRLQSWRKRLPRLETQIAQAQRAMGTHQSQLSKQLTSLTDLLAWQAQLEKDNQANPNPPPYVEARMDAGFASGENLTWLLEMGYCPNTKAPNGQTATALCAHLPKARHWVKVGENAEMLGWGEYRLHGCAYPLTAAIERFKVGRRFKYAVLLHMCEENAPFPTLPVWFHHYNERQTIEAGNKEMKGTFHVQHLLSRSLAGIQLQVLFTGLAANVVRWCVPWLKQCAHPGTPKLTRTLNSPRQLVRIAANSTALVQQSSWGTSLQFAPTSSLPGVILFLKGVPAFQLSLGFNQPYKIDSG